MRPNLGRPVKLTADLIEAFAGIYLSPRYDDPMPTPQFHRVAWELYCSDDPLVALAAPREHAKSTGLTFVFILAENLFRISDYTILTGSTEDMAAEQLSNIREELLENVDLRQDFGIVELEQDSKVDIIVRCDDGHRFRILARGAEQKIRGRLWNGKRPNLFVGDDMEDDEQVENRDRRRKFRHWFYRAARQAVSRRGRVRVHGTILHEDSFLNHCIRGKSWKSLLFKAHNSFDDFGGILWPEMWPEERLRSRQKEFVEDPEGGAAGYAQEFLNDPQDSSEAYLRRQDFLPMETADYARTKIYGAAADFAVSKNDMANRTSFTVGGICPFNLLHIVDERVGRWASIEIKPNGSKEGWIEEMFSIQQRWQPQFFWVEAGVIWEGIKHLVYAEMRERDIWLNIIEVPSIKDKATRGRTFQKRHRAGGIRFDKQGEWYPSYEHELLRFTGSSQAILDDQFDSSSLLALGFDKYMMKVDEEDFMEDEEIVLRLAAKRKVSVVSERNSVTGY